MEKDNMEILVTLVTEPDKPRSVKFTDLKSLQDRICGMLFLWNCNSYYVDCVKKIFIINGGRKLKMGGFQGDCRVMYRRRNQMDMSFASEKPSEKRVIWIIGLDEIGASNRMFLKISEDGKSWKWETVL
jgi:hypothetical protein